MSTQTADLPVLLTRADVANLLRLSPRQVDRLAADGTLRKQKLSASRSGFERSSVEAHLRKMAGASNPSGNPSPGNLADFTLANADYGSRGMVLIVDVEGDAALVGEALDEWLPANGVRGCLVMAGGGRVAIMWARNLGLQVERVRKAIEAVKATAVHA